MAYSCGSCGGRHQTAAEGRACWRARRPAGSGIGDAPFARPDPVPRVRRSEQATVRRTATPTVRLDDVHAVLVLLGQVKGPSTTKRDLRRWAANRDITALVGYAESHVRAIATALDGNRDGSWPTAIRRRAEQIAKNSARDASTVLEGRNERRTTGGHPAPADREIHRRIGPIDTNE